MKIAILGGTGQIGRALARAYAPRHRVTLFARRTEAARRFLEGNALDGEVESLEQLGRERFDLWINAIGAGAPARIQALGSQILEVTSHFDAQCLRAAERHSGSTYLFLSTGALYGPDYGRGHASDPMLQVPIARTDPAVWYLLAKRIAELRHRERGELPILDVRIFGFVSNEMSLGDSFLVAQMLRALRAREPFVTSSHDLVRDYVGTLELVELVDCLLAAGSPSGAYDLMSAAPTSKLRLLDALSRRHGLCYTHSDQSPPLLSPLPPSISADRAAAKLGFRAGRGSLECVLAVADRFAPERPAIAVEAV